MFELVILSVICFAAAYAAFLWREGRRDDVLFGAFVESLRPTRSRKPADIGLQHAMRPRALCASLQALLTTER
jgi:hypothetical protein